MGVMLWLGFPVACVSKHAALLVSTYQRDRAAYIALDIYYNCGCLEFSFERDKEAEK